MADTPIERTEVRLYGDLAWFCPDADRAGIVTVPAGRRRSVKDLIESVGVPHVEVGGVLVDGDAARLDHVVEHAERLAVYPPGHDLTPCTAAPTPRPPRFVADVHLGALARLLRLLGIDTWWCGEADDAALADRAVQDRRVLLSRDRHLLMRRVVRHGYCPRSHDPDAQLREVVARYRLHDDLDPFTRCAECNGPLARVERSAVLDRLPPRTRAEHDTFSRCRGCDRVYWPGSHVAALRARLEDLLP